MKDNLPFTGELFLGHLRYGTFGENTIEQCHPFLRQKQGGEQEVWYWLVILI